MYIMLIVHVTICPIGVYITISVVTPNRVTDASHYNGIVLKHLYHYRETPAYACWGIPILGQHIYESAEPLTKIALEHPLSAYLARKHTFHAARASSFQETGQRVGSIIWNGKPHYFCIFL